MMGRTPVEDIIRYVVGRTPISLTADPEKNISMAKWDSVVTPVR